MEKKLIYKKREVQKLQDRVTELERRLAEAQATISTLVSPKGDRLQRQSQCKSEQVPHEMEQQREKESATFLVNEERLQHALAVAPYPLMIRRDDGKVVMINVAWTELTGYTLEDIPTIEEWTRRAYGRLGSQRQAFILKEGFSQEGIKKWGEFEVTTRSGTKRIWDFSTAPLGFDENGRELVMTMAVDITERKQAEESLRAARDEAMWLARLPGENPNPVVRVSAQGIVLYHNPPAANLPGWTCVKNEPLALPLRPLVHQALTQSQIVEQEVTLGTKIYVVFVVPILHESYANLYGRDITEQKKAEEALRESEQRYRGLFEKMQEGLVAAELVTDTNGKPIDYRYLDVNPATERQFGIPREQFVGHTYTEVLPEGDREWIEIFGKVGLTGEPVSLERYGRASKRWFECHVYSPRPGQVINITTDITDRKRTEEALRKRESILAQAGEMAHLGAWDIEFHNLDDLNANPLTWSEEVYRIFGYAPGEVQASNELFFERVHPDDRALVQESVAQAISKRQPYVIEHRIRRPDGEERIVQEHAEVFFDEGGKPLRMVGAVQDITEHKEAEAALRKLNDRLQEQAEELEMQAEELRVQTEELGMHAENLKIKTHELEAFNDQLSESEQRLKRAQEIAHLGSWELDLVHNRLTWSDEVYRIFGLQPQEFGATYGAFLEAVHPDDRAAVDAAYSESIRAGENSYEIEHRVVKRSNGEVRIVHEKCEHFRNQDGQIIRSIGMVHDITEWKQAEQARQESEERFRSLADSMPQLVWTALPDGTVDYYNSRAREYWGIQQVMTTHWEWAPVLHPDDVQATVNTWLHSVETGETYQAEHRVRMADGSYRWHLSRGMPMRDEKGRVIRWFGTATDIHDLKLAEEKSKVYAERLEHSNRELEQFAFMASHDLQEPLRKIEVFGDLLLESSKSLSGRERNYLERMRDAAGRMRDMVDGLLQLSRVTTQGKPFVPVNLSQMTADVLYDLEDQIRRTGGNVEVGSLPAIEGDPLQLHQLLQNLIGNALKYHPPETPPAVKVYAEQLSDRVQIFVEDKGIGFDQEHAERVFQPFQRLVGRSQYEGSGMGLAICRRIVERHNGEIAARSQPGSGATFIVTLPMYQPESTRRQAGKDANNEVPGTAPGR